MKRFLVLLLTGGLSLTLFGCTQNAQSIGGTTDTTSQTFISTDAMSDENVTDENTEGTQNDVKSGTVSETTYTQPHFGFKITLEDPWVYADDEDLSAQEQLLIHAAEDEEVLEAVAKGNLLIDMAANNPETFNNLMVRIVKLNLADYFLEEETLYGTFLSMIREDAAATGLTDLEDQTGRISFLGKETRYVGVNGMLALSDTLSTEMYNYCIILKEGNYACLIYISGIPEFGSESFESVVARFRTA